MKIAHKQILSLLLINAFSLYGLSCTFAADKREEAITGSKRHFEQAVDTQVKPVMFCHPWCPSDLTKHTLLFLAEENDQRALLRSSETCKKLNLAVMSIYADYNQLKKNDVWQENVSLSPLALYTVNSRMLTILGIYNSLRGENEGLVQDRHPKMADANKFETLCAQFLKAPFFKENAVPKILVDNLQRSLSLFHYSIIEDQIQLFHDFKEACKKNYSQYLASLTMQQRRDYKNERILCFFGLQFLCETPSTELDDLKKEYLFSELDNPFMALFNYDLLSLKKWLGISSDHKYAGVWERIIDLEPNPTIRQLVQAAISCRDFAQNARGKEVTAKYCAKAVEYFEKSTKALESAGEILTATDYNNIARANYQAGINTQDETLKERYFVKAAANFYLRLKALVSAGKIPPPIEYLTTAWHNYQAGVNTQDETVKGRCFSKATECCEIALALNEGVDRGILSNARKILADIYSS